MIVLLHTEQFTATQVLSSGAWAVNSGWPRLCSQPGLSTGLPSVPRPHRFSCSVHSPDRPCTIPHPAAETPDFSTDSWLCDHLAPAARCPVNLPNPLCTGWPGYTRPMAAQALPSSCQAIPLAFPAPSQCLCLELAPMPMHCSSCEPQLGRICVSSPQCWPGT